MNKLEKAVNCLIKAASRVHPLIHALKVSQPKPTRKPRTVRRPKMYDGATEAKEALDEKAATENPTKASNLLEESIVGKDSKKKHFAKGSQEAKDFMNMLRLRRKGKK